MLRSANNLVLEMQSEAKQHSFHYSTSPRTKTNSLSPYMMKIMGYWSTQAQEGMDLLQEAVKEVQCPITCNYPKS